MMFSHDINVDRKVLDELTDGKPKILREVWEHVVLARHGYFEFELDKKIIFIYDLFLNNYKTVEIFKHFSTLVVF